MDVLIGRPFTDNPMVPYSREDENLVFRNKRGDLSENGASTTNEGPQVTADVTLSPLTVALIETRINEVNHLLPVVNYDTKDRKLRKESSVCRGQLSGLPVMSVHLPREPVKEEDLNVGNEHPEAVIAELLNIANKFRDCIAFNVFEIGCARGIEVEINEKPGSMPVNSKPHPSSISEHEKIRSILTEWREAGIVRDAGSSYASPVMLVAKKNGDKRLIVIFNKLNNQTQCLHFLMPDADDHFTEIGDSTS